MEGTIYIYMITPFLWAMITPFLRSVVAQSVEGIALYS